MRIRLTLAILLNGDHRGETWTRDSGTRYENRAATTKGNLHVPRQFVKGNLLVPPSGLVSCLCLRLGSVAPPCGTIMYLKSQVF